MQWPTAILSHASQRRLPRLNMGVSCTGESLVKSSKSKLDLYFVSAVLFGWIAFSWITFLTNETGTSDRQFLTLMAVPYLTVSCLAILAALTRQQFFLFATATATFFLSAFFALNTDYWWFWTGGNAVVSFLGLMLSAYSFRKSKNESVLKGS